MSDTDDTYEIEPTGFEVPAMPGGVSVASDEEDAQERRRVGQLFLDDQACRLRVLWDEQQE